MQNRRSVLLAEKTKLTRKIFVGWAIFYSVLLFIFGTTFICFPLFKIIERYELQTNMQILRMGLHIDDYNTYYIFLLGAFQFFSFVLAIVIGQSVFSLAKSLGTSVKNPTYWFSYIMRPFIILISLILIGFIGSTWIIARLHEHTDELRVKVFAFIGPQKSSDNGMVFYWKNFRPHTFNTKGIDRYRDIQSGDSLFKPANTKKIFVKKNNLGTWDQVVARHKKHPRKKRFFEIPEFETGYWDKMETPYLYEDLVCTSQKTLCACYEYENYIVSRENKYSKIKVYQNKLGKKNNCHLPDIDLIVEYGDSISYFRGLYGDNIYVSLNLDPHLEKLGIFNLKERKEVFKGYVRPFIHPINPENGSFTSMKLLKGPPHPDFVCPSIPDMAFSDKIIYYELVNVNLTTYKHTPLNVYDCYRKINRDLRFYY